MLGGADNLNGELPSYITGANTVAFFPQDGQARLPHELVRYFT